MANTINERNLDDQHTLTYTENDLHETINKQLTNNTRFTRNN